MTESEEAVAREVSFAKNALTDIAVRLTVVEDELSMIRTATAARSLIALGGLNQPQVDRLSKFLWAIFEMAADDESPVGHF